MVLLIVPVFSPHSSILLLSCVWKLTTIRRGFQYWRISNREAKCCPEAIPPTSELEAEKVSDKMHKNSSKKGKRFQTT